MSAGQLARCIRVQTEPCKHTLADTSCEHVMGPATEGGPIRHSISSMVLVRQPAVPISRGEEAWNPARVTVHRERGPREEVLQDAVVSGSGAVSLRTYTHVAAHVRKPQRLRSSADPSRRCPEKGDVSDVHRN